MPFFNPTIVSRAAGPGGLCLRIAQGRATRINLISDEGGSLMSGECSLEEPRYIHGDDDALSFLRKLAEYPVQREMAPTPRAGVYWDMQRSHDRWWAHDRYTNEMFADTPTREFAAQHGLSKDLLAQRTEEHDASLSHYSYKDDGQRKTAFGLEFYSTDLTRHIFENIGRHTIGGRASFNMTLDFAPWSKGWVSENPTAATHLFAFGHPVFFNVRSCFLSNEQAKK